jgi:class 3 adenylate cyclase/tetratricopeptide (TPR) repeat protein
VNATEQVKCSSCGELTPAAGRFCIHCAAPLQRACPNCGAPVVAGARFCMQCATPLTAAGATSRPSAPEALSERRLVSVLFADLVGFTALSERRDPEEVRELLSRYFERCRTIIERYGGTVEKFIGDAVMAVWGTPVAREDDAERAARAALALVQRVAVLGDEVGMPELRLRAGVLTGNAAVEVGAEGEGMVLGDTVNTASRLQSIAQPGTVLVDDTTRRASEAAIAYEDAGTHAVKGREQPVRAWVALRVVAGAGGARRSAGPEAPFMGRDRELQAIIEAGEESAQQSEARYVAIAGEAGSGKSRLIWEYFKYLDGIQELRLWHQGRCLSYGEGVAYWALAEMVRTRARIQEEENPAAARAKLRAIVEEYVPEERERRLVEPRLAHLLRLEERPEADRADLFSGWRLFFERLSHEGPVILAFEDLQWADSGLLDFIDYLLEWSAHYPIFVLALGRLELRERRPGWEPLVLSPLEPQEIAGVLEGLAPGLPDDVVGQIVERSEGIPLYAVETIRMLQDRGVLVQEGARYHITGDLSDIEVPETLHALVASRLDGLSAAERSLLQDASVLGHSFSATSVAAVGGLPAAQVEQLLDGLVHKQIVARDEDPRSPERGQYVFIQALLRTVAYGTLARQARKSKHLAAARYLEQTWPGESRDIAEVLASHYLEAIRADPDAADVGELRASARERLTSAGQAAASLALGPEAERYFEHAAQLADEDLERATLYEQAGRALRQWGDPAGAERRLHDAIELYRASGVQTGGRAAVALATHMRHMGRLEEAKAVLEPFRTSDDDTNPLWHAEALAELGAIAVFAGELDQGGPLLEDALTTLEREQSWSALTDALVTRSVYLIYRQRFEEGVGVLRQALTLAQQHEVTGNVLRAMVNLAQVSLERDHYAEAVDEVGKALVIARERGDRQWELRLIGQEVWPLAVLGRWDEASADASLLIGGSPYVDAVFAAASIISIAAARGDEATLERCHSLALEARESAYVDQRICAGLVFAREAIERGALGEAVTAVAPALSGDAISGDAMKDAFDLSIEAAIAQGDRATLSELMALVDGMPPVRLTPLLRAGRARLKAELAHRDGDGEVVERFEDEAIGLLRSLGARPLLALTLIERARRHDDPAALAEARTIYEELGAVRWLGRLEATIGVTA